MNVNGNAAHPLWVALRASCPAPSDTIAGDTTPSWLPVTTRDVSWNFEQILIAKNGTAYKRYYPTVLPGDLAADVTALLAA